MRGPWVHYLSEFVGTALLIAIGLSFVILNFGTGSPMLALVPGAGPRRLLTGFLFGATGGLLAYSPVGKVSGAHINPAVTWAFWWLGKMRTRHAVGYVLAQLAGGVLGAVPLLAWGGIGASQNFGATAPGPYFGAGWAVAGEFATTCILIVSLFLFLRHRRLRNFTPLLFPFLYAVMVFLEAPVSGTSTNPARTLGPEVISATWRGWWVYWAGPLLGAAAGVLFYKISWLRHVEIEVAKFYHFDYDPHGIFRWEEQDNQ